MNIMRAIIVDDEQLLIGELKELLEEYSDIKVTGMYSNPLQALEEINVSTPDVAFLDINMVEMDGVELAEALIQKIPDIEILFVTAYNQYATEAFDINAVDYMLKPIRPERLQRALNRLEKRIGLKNITEQSLKIQFFNKFGINYGDQEVKWSRAKQRELLAYLLQYKGIWMDKYRICDDIWSSCEPDKALAQLQTAIWAVRKVLKEYNITDLKIEYSNDCYILQTEDVSIDIYDFEMVGKKYLDSGKNKYLEKAESIYKNGYFYNDDWPWAIIERERYSRRLSELIHHSRTINKHQ